jgi:choline-glycine betaine transporter
VEGEGMRKLIRKGDAVDPIRNELDWLWLIAVLFFVLLCLTMVLNELGKVNP